MRGNHFWATNCSRIGCDLYLILRSWRYTLLELCRTGNSGVVNQTPLKIPQLSLMVPHIWPPCTSILFFFLMQGASNEQASELEQSGGDGDGCDEKSRPDATMTTRR